MINVKCSRLRFFGWLIQGTGESSVSAASSQHTTRVSYSDVLKQGLCSLHFKWLTCSISFISSYLFNIVYLQIIFNKMSLTISLVYHYQLWSLIEKLIKLSNRSCCRLFIALILNSEFRGKIKLTWNQTENIKMTLRWIHTRTI